MTTSLRLTHFAQLPRSLRNSEQKAARLEYRQANLVCSVQTVTRRVFPMCHRQPRAALLPKCDGEALRCRIIQLYRHPSTEAVVTKSCVLPRTRHQSVSLNVVSSVRPQVQFSDGCLTSSGFTFIHHLPCFASACYVRGMDPHSHYLYTSFTFSTLSTDAMDGDITSNSTALVCTDTLLTSPLI